MKYKVAKYKPGNMVKILSNTLLFYNEGGYIREYRLNSFEHDVVMLIEPLSAWSWKVLFKGKLYRISSDQIVRRIS